MSSAAADLDLRGGHAVIDFVNTVAWRGDAARRTDYLADYADVVAWCRHAGVLAAAESAALIRTMRADAAGAQRVVTRTKRLRESLHELFTGDAQSALVALRDVYVDALRRKELRRVGDKVAWADREVTLSIPVDRLAADAVELITEISLDRIKRCGDIACGWLFVDRSHRQNRRWCSAADCGNRERARRHYERARD
ncbi:MAG TPA: CGNR zinc finger domain-containing protein [Mycobacterium sp.]|nr:CGNR zinc finger domain-containing protein [Mycobacterium sp.]